MFSCPLALLLSHLLSEHQSYLHKTVIEYLGKNLRSRERNTEKYDTATLNTSCITSARKNLKGCHAGLDACPYGVFAGMTEIQLFYCRSNNLGSFQITRDRITAFL
jgi:hypothetical protein